MNFLKNLTTLSVSKLILPFFIILNIQKKILVYEQVSRWVNNENVDIMMARFIGQLDTIRVTPEQRLSEKMSRQLWPGGSLWSCGLDSFNWCGKTQAESGQPCFLGLDLVWMKRRKWAEWSMHPCTSGCSCHANSFLKQLLLWLLCCHGL